jgi:hypothetical protein
MACCDTHAHIFGFSEDGMSLKIRSPQSMGPVLLKYFKHGSLSSFIRQLNNYGFKTISSVSNGNSVQTFAHPYFYRDGKDLLDTITRKTAKNVKKCKGDIIKELQHVETEYRKRFRDMESRNHSLERKNDALEHENKRLRVLCQELEVKARIVVPLEPIPLMRSMCHQTGFESHPSMVEPGLETSSSLGSDMTRSPYGDDVYESAQQHPTEKVGVDHDILESLMQAEAGWVCTGNEFMV